MDGIQPVLVHCLSGFVTGLYLDVLHTFGVSRHRQRPGAVCCSRRGESRITPSRTAIEGDSHRRHPPGILSGTGNCVRGVVEVGILHRVVYLQDRSILIDAEPDFPADFGCYRSKLE